MSGYTNILAAVDLTPLSAQVCSKAAELARHFGATLGLIHVIEPIVMDAAYDMLPIMSSEVEEAWRVRAAEELARLGDQWNVPKEWQWLSVGAAKLEIMRVAKEAQVDLIVVGSHGRHGIARLLGSTANAVVQAAPCDVLAVRVTNHC